MKYRIPLTNETSPRDSKSAGGTAMESVFRPHHPVIVRILPFIIVLLLALLHCGVVWAIGKESQLAWGVNAVVLKSPWNGMPSLDDLLADQEHTICLNRFYHDGGLNIPATPTECRIGYTRDELLVVFRCTETNMSFPAATRNAEDWYKLINLRDYADTLFPDQVDFLVQPDVTSPSYYQFAMTPDGKKLGCSRLAGADFKPGMAIHAEKVQEFEANVTRRANEWVVFFRIPWTTFGGKPSSYFGILPLRTRWRNGEVSSPVALDFMDEINSTMKSGLQDAQAVDLFIETHFSGPEMQPVKSDLCRLPSGVLRWQRPALATYPDVEMRQRIWQMQCSLRTPTDTNSLAERLSLTRGWTDLMTLEGFTGLPRAWSGTIDNLQHYVWRRDINAALRVNDLGRACQLLDNFLGKLDKVSRWWYADGSPGDILKSEWTPVTSAESLEVQGNTLLMCCQAGGHSMGLHLVLPKTGGVRIFGSSQGYFKPAELLPLEVTRRSGSCTINTADGRVVVSQKPFSVSFYNTAGKKVTQLGANDLAFRFAADGKVLALDFKNHLDSDEVIYGFGERYDYFNENGNVVTLWGTDDWIGNGVGFRNTTYKPLPIFHSSKGYMVYDNSTYRLRGDIGRTDLKQYRITQQGPIFDFYFFLGAPQKSLHSYTALTGRVPLPPKWVFEPWMGRGESAWEGNPLEHFDPVQEETNTILRFAELDIPHSAIYAEGPTANMPVLHEFATPRGIRILGYFAPEIPFSRQQSLMPELKPEELPILRCGDTNICPGINYVDWTHPQAKELVRRWLKPALDLGVAGSMVDFGDMVPDEAVFYDGRRGDEMHNDYTYAYHKTVSELYREKRGNDFILYGRAAAPGGQHWVGQFAGDHSGNFAGLKAVLTGALNLCACGYSTWGSDVCGYFGMPEPGVYMRWFQFACFSPIWRPHGKTTRDPWSYGDAAVTNYKFLAWTRENILDYTYNAAVVAHETGVPIMRSMPLSFPGEQAVAPVRDEYMFGPDLLVAPVLTDDTSRTIVFPKGTWASLWDGKTVKGPAKLNVSTPLDTIPVYLRPGAVVPVQLNRELQVGQSMTPGRVSALVATPASASQTVSLVTDQGKAGKVTVRPQSHGCIWEVENLPETSYLLVYGVSSAAKVKVDGNAVPQVTTIASAMQAGWKADPAGNRLVICLASATAQATQATRTIEVDLGSSEN
jgi:alpha-glucosidase (family GH31 glycosyl hydrolase)